MQGRGMQTGQGMGQGAGQGANFVDANNDGTCDNLGTAQGQQGMQGRNGQGRGMQGAACRAVVCRMGRAGTTKTSHEFQVNSL